MTVLGFISSSSVLMSVFLQRTFVRERIVALIAFSIGLFSDVFARVPIRRTFTSDSRKVLLVALQWLLY